jgi:uncharacterized protein
MKYLSRLLILLLVVLSGYFIYAKNGNNANYLNKPVQPNLLTRLQENLHPLSVERMRSQQYPGSDIVIEDTLAEYGNYTEYLASYRSEGLKIYALLTIPKGSKPASGWPVIIFNHGYIPPAQYRSNERYLAYVAGFASNGYIVFKPDYRGHGNSEGKPEGAYFSPAYTIDVLNAVGSIKRHKEADKSRIGMWGHSLGGNITQRAATITKDIKAAVVWGGVVGNYSDIYEIWFNRRRNSNEATAQIQQSWRMNRTRFINLYGTPESNPGFWNSIDPIKHLEYFSTPIQIHHAKGDETVTYRLSEEFAKDLEAAGKTHELYLYEGDDHNLSANFNIAMQRSVAFFDKYLK